MDTETHHTSEENTDESPSLLRQVTGAVVGGTLALSAYYAYEFASPVVTAWLIPPGYEAELGHNTIADKDVDDTDTRHIQAQARRIAANVKPVPEYEQPYRQGATASSASSVRSEPVAMHSAEDNAADDESIWEQEWKEELPKDTEPQSTTEHSAPPEPVRGAEGDPVPQLPDSGLGLWVLIGTAGAAAGSPLWRRKKR